MVEQKKSGKERARDEAPHPFKKIGIPAVVAATHVLKPQQPEKKAEQPQRHPMLEPQDHD